MLKRPPDPDRKRQRKPLTPEERVRLDKLAADKRDYRILIDDGGAVLKGLPVRDINGLIEALIELRWLKEAESENRKALVAAVGALLDDIVSRRRSMS